MVVAALPVLKRGDDDRGPAAVSTPVPPFPAVEELKYAGADPQQVARRPRRQPVFERGDQLYYCAGAIADLYAKLGGDVLYAGKPYAPIYELALKLAGEARGGTVDRARVLAIGDSVRTDFMGAASYGIDCLFVTAGIHAGEFGGREDPDPDAVERVLLAAGGRPRAIARKLKW